MASVVCVALVLSDRFKSVSAIAQQIAIVGEQSLQKLLVEAGQLEATLANTQSLIKEAQARLAQTQVRSPTRQKTSECDVWRSGDSSV